MFGGFYLQEINVAQTNLIDWQNVGMLIYQENYMHLILISSFY